MSFFKKTVCLSVCLTFFESADARDLGLMTLFSATAHSFNSLNVIEHFYTFIYLLSDTVTGCVCI